MKIINLTYGRMALVDDEDYPYLSQFLWRAHKSKNKWYASRNFWISETKTSGTMLMHREILELVKGEQCDHRDGNGLNNQRSNLRKCSQPENNANRTLNRNNTSGFKGVSWHPGMKKWSSEIRARGIRKKLGYFEYPQQAAAAYDQELENQFPQFAITNKMIKQTNESESQS